MSTTYRFAPVLVRVLAFCSAILWAVTPCKALSVIEIPTGPFCDGCVVTNVYYYSPDDVLDWSRGLSLDVAEIRAECETLRTSINRLAFGYESYSINSLITKTTTDILWYSEHSVDSTDEENILDTLRDYQRLLQSSQREASVQLSELTTIQTQLNELDLYASDVVPEYSARFAVACTGGTNDVCCSCPDYTPYFVTITNRLYGISVNVSVMRNQFNWIYSMLYGVDNYLSDIANVGLEDALDVILLAKLRQIGGFSEFYDAWDSLMDEDQLWSYPVTSHAVMSNLMASTHLYPHGIQTSLATYGATYAQTPTYDTLEGMPMLDRITVLLKEMSGTNVVQAIAEANATAEANAANDELSIDDEQEQQAITEEFDPSDVDVDVGISALWASMRGLVDAFEVDLPRQVVVYEGGDWVPGMTIQTSEWDTVFSFCRFLSRAVWVFVLFGLAGRLARFYAVLAMSFARLAYGVAQGSVDEWRNAWSGFVDTWGRLLSGAGGD